MDVFKRYLIIFVTTSTFLYFFVIWYESQNLFKLYDELRIERLVELNQP